MKKIKKMFLFVLLLSAVPQVFGVEIHQILYDPAGSDSGSEAVELYNPEDVDISITGWTIATSVSDSDVTFPKNTIILARSFFLVADEGWNVSKNSSWRLADYEETMTLPNDDSGIALKDKSGNVVDAVGWGNSTKIKAGLYTGAPAKSVKEGFSLVRISSTGNNFVDFVEKVPILDGGEEVIIFVDILSPMRLIKSVQIIGDDSSDAGIQIMPVAGQNRSIIISAEIDGGGSPYAEFFGKQFFLSKTNVSNKYSATILVPYSFLPSNYSVAVVLDGQQTLVNFDYLALKKFEVLPRSVSLSGNIGGSIESSDDIVLKNLGNVAVNVAVSNGALRGKNDTISAQNLRLRKKSANSLLERIISLPIGAEEKLSVALDIPDDVSTGIYSSVMRFRAD